MVSIFHPHGVFSGKAKPLVAESVATGIRGFQFAEGNDFQRLKPICQGQICILGGVDAFTTLLFGPQQRIEEETAWFMRTCAPGGGYIFMCSCSLHRGMPLENLDALARACREHGRYGAPNP